MRDLTNYMPLLNKIAGAFPKQYRDDLVQEGYLILHRANELYDETLGASFETYVSRAVFRHMRKYVESFTKNVSLDNTIEDEDGNPVSYADLLVDGEDVYAQIEAQDYWNKNLEKCTPIERFIKVKHFVDGMSEQDIIDLYKELHMISSVRTLRKILKK